MRQRMRHDTWMTIVLGTQRCAILSFPALEPRVFAWWNVIMLCNSVRAVFVGVLFTPPSVVWKFFSNQPKLVLTMKKCTNRQTMKNARNSNCSSSNCFDPTLLTKTKLSTSLSATLYRTFSLCEGRLHNHIPLVQSLPFVRRAIFCILLPLEQSEIVDVMVAELLFWVRMRIQHVEFRILSAFVATYEWFYKAILSNSIISCSVHPISDNDFLHL